MRSYEATTPATRIEDNSDSDEDFTLETEEEDDEDDSEELSAKESTDDVAAAIGRKSLKHSRNGRKSSNTKLKKTSLKAHRLKRHSPP